MALRTQNTASGSGVANASCSVTVVSGDRIVVCIYERDGGAISSVTSDIDGALTQDRQRAVTAAQSAIYSKSNATGGTHTITVDFGTGRTFDFTVAVFSGQATTGADTTNAAGNSATTSHGYGAVTPSASALVITCLGTGSDHGGATVPAGFTALNVDAGANTNRQSYAYKEGHTGAVTPTTTTVNSVSSDGTIAAYLESAGGGGAALRPVFTRMGARRL